MDSIGVAVIGFGWMGRVHTQAYARLRHHYPDLPVPLSLIHMLDDPRIGAVSITAPNFLHREIGAAFAATGRHLWIEKPVGLDAADARAIAGDGHVSVGFNYRHAPAVQKARAILRDGGIGRVTHARFQFLSDYAAAPDGALTWRFLRSRGGNGVLGDLGAHAVDLVRHLLGEIDEVVAADTAIFIPRRPAPGGATTGHERGTGPLGPVENEDWLAALLRAGDARVTIEASRVASGEQNNYGFAIHGTDGVLSWDFRRMGELVVNGRPIFAGPGDGEFAAFQPGPGNAMSYDDLKVIEAALFLRSITSGVPHGATLSDAIRAAEVLSEISRKAG